MSNENNRVYNIQPGGRFRLPRLEAEDESILLIRNAGDPLLTSIIVTGEGIVQPILVADAELFFWGGERWTHTPVVTRGSSGGGGTAQETAYDDTLHIPRLNGNNLQAALDSIKNSFLSFFPEPDTISAWAEVPDLIVTEIATDRGLKTFTITGGNAALYYRKGDLAKLTSSPDDVGILVSDVTPTTITGENPVVPANVPADAADLSEPLSRNRLTFTAKTNDSDPSFYKWTTGSSVGFALLAGIEYYGKLASLTTGPWSLLGAQVPSGFVAIASDDLSVGGMFEVVGVSDGELVLKRLFTPLAGGTAGRPAFPRQGEPYFDTDLTPPRMIFWTGVAWVNMDGTALP